MAAKIHGTLLYLKTVLIAPNIALNIRQKKLDQTSQVQVQQNKSTKLLDYNSAIVKNTIIIKFNSIRVKQ